MSRVNSLAGSMDKLGRVGFDDKSESSEGAGKVEMSSTIARVEEMIAAGLILPMRFPDPGKPDGIRTFRKPVMTLKDCSFKYPETDKYILEKDRDAHARLARGHRRRQRLGQVDRAQAAHRRPRAREGVGEVWKHHNLRLSYVAQQSLHHLEDYVQVTPIHYIQERFRQGLDAEVGKLKTQAITDEEKEQMKEPGAVVDIVGRAKKQTFASPAGAGRRTTRSRCRSPSSRRCTSRTSRR